MVIAIFWSRARPENSEAYLEYAEATGAIARSMPGFPLSLTAGSAGVAAA